MRAARGDHRTRVRKYPHHAICPACEQNHLYYTAAVRTTAVHWCGLCRAQLAEDRARLDRRSVEDWLERIGRIGCATLRGWVACVVWWKYLAGRKPLAELVKEFPYNYHHGLSRGRLMTALRSVGYSRLLLLSARSALDGIETEDEDNR
jgi:hypothetical protein